MILHDDGKKLNFLVGVHVSYADALTGGIVAMHMLAYKLAERGHNVYVFTEPQFPHENIKSIKSVPSDYINGVPTVFNWDTIHFPYRNTISIYPQITRGNPYQTEHVSRWILYHTEMDIEKTYGPNDVYFNFGEFKCYLNNDHEKLTVFDYRFNDLYITNQGERKGFCHILHKNTPDNAKGFLSKFNSTDLGAWKTSGCYDYLREKFNQHEYFLTYDQKSFLTLAAILCGCKAIILRENYIKEEWNNAFTDSSSYNRSLSPTEYRLENPIQMFGVAYGIEDISWANKTIDFSRDHLNELQKIDDKTVDSFIDFWEKRINPAQD
jgi:hypothetical protein